MRYTLVAGLCALMPLFTISAQPASHEMRPTSTSTTARPTGKPVARVNGAVLTDRDLLREMFTIFPYARQHNGGFPKAMEASTWALVTGVVAQSAMSAPFTPAPSASAVSFSSAFSAVISA